MILIRHPWPAGATAKREKDTMSPFSRLPTWELLLSAFILWGRTYSWGCGKQDFCSSMEDLKKKKNDSQGSNELTESTHRLSVLLRWTACRYSKFVVFWNKVKGNAHISEEEYSGALILVPSFSLQQNSSSIWTPGYGEAPERGGRGRGSLQS